MMYVSKFQNPFAGDKTMVDDHTALDFSIKKRLSYTKKAIRKNAECKKKKREEIKGK